MTESAAAPAPGGPTAAPDQPTFDTLPGAAPVARLLLGADGTVSHCDAEAARLLGRAPTTVVGDPLPALAAGPDAARLRAALTPGTGAPVAICLEVALERADREPFAAELTLSDLPSATSQASWMATFHDVSARRRAEQASLAAEAAVRAMARAGSPERALRSLLAVLGAAMGWSVGAYWSVAHDGSLERRASWRAGGEDPAALPPLGPGRVLPRKGSLAGRALERDAITWVDDLAADPELVTAADARAAELHAAVGAPVRRDGEPIGVIVFLADVPRPADPAVAETLAAAGARIGELLAILEERHALLASLARLALTDQLTGLPNRRAWEEALARELARAGRGGHSVCVAVLDLDNFKAYNDEHGHPAGDRVLAESARAWQRQLRASDLLARYGGEEFAAVIPAWPLQTAVDVVERLRRATPGPLTASAGVAHWDGEESGAAIVARADAALYAAKQRGRDRTVAAESSDAA